MEPDLDPPGLSALVAEEPPPAVDRAALRAARAAFEGRAPPVPWLPLGLIGVAALLHAAVAVRALALLFG